mmetsp:Transcript_28198/g.90411  ORF Transcript_28198/g.90411 Transcript_28198/m.90411 type:complete len:205 (-) Transcript_28198:246-860(-)
MESRTFGTQGCAAASRHANAPDDVPASSTRRERERERLRKVSACRQQAAREPFSGRSTALPRVLALDGDEAGAVWRRAAKRHVRDLHEGAPAREGEGAAARCGTQAAGGETTAASNGRVGRRPSFARCATRSKAAPRPPSRPQHGAATSRSPGAAAREVARSAAPSRRSGCSESGAAGTEHAAVHGAKPHTCKGGGLQSVGGAS